MHRPTTWERGRGYALALAFSVAAILVRLALGGTSSLVFVTFYPAAMASGWWGGRGPALVTIAFCSTAAVTIWMPSFTPGSPQAVNLLLFVAVSLTISLGAAQLRDAQRRLRSLLEATSEGFAIVDRRWRCVYANPRLARLLGVQPRDVVGRSFWDVFAQADDLGQAARAAMAGEHGRHAAHQAPSGLWVETLLFPTREGIALLARDMTAERELDRRRSELITQLEAANRLKDEFLATLSHELRTPLGAITNWAHVLEGRAPAEAKDRAVEAIMRNAAGLRRLVDDLLDTARITAGTLRVEMQPTDFAAVVRGAADTARAAAADRGVNIELHDGSDPEWVMGDPGRLSQAALNLLTNAIKFSPAGGRVAVRVSSRKDAVLLIVEDEGVGIEADQLPRIFDRFVQAHAPFAAAREGLGLGLAITKHIVEAHGGTLLAHSNGPMRGATFTIALPTLQRVGKVTPISSRESLAASLLGVIGRDRENDRSAD